MALEFLYRACFIYVCRSLGSTEMLRRLLRALFHNPPARKYHKRKRLAPEPNPPSKPISRASITPSGSPAAKVLKGKAYVIDGDTIVISGTHIRIAGIDAPELDHPWGKKSKFAMIQLCKGKIVTATLDSSSSYDRVVGKCHLDDGTDLAEALVTQGLALDWPKYSGGAYRHLEPDGIRKKLWRAAARQQGRYKPGT